MDLPLRLRAETSREHLLLESAFDIEQAMHDIGWLRDLLSSLYEVIVPLERELGRHLPAETLIGRGKTDLLRRDLTALGVDPLPLQTTSFDGAAALCRNQARALGALYVLEGSTLGGHVVAKMLRRSPVWPAAGLSYFDPYGRRTGEMWRAFCDMLRRFSSLDHDDEVLAGANATFVAFRHRIAANAGADHG